MAIHAQTLKATVDMHGKGGTGEMGLDERPLKLTNEQLRKLQLEMFKILIEFDRICRKHHIQYFLSCGTLLGAVRHKGFIPWDDDIDVEMTRSEYRRFCEICEAEIDSKHFFFQNHENDHDYNWVFGKMRLKNTQYIRVGQSHLKQKNGICIDIFVLDNISSNYLIERTMEKGTELCRKILWSPVGAVRSKSSLKRLWFKGLSCIPRKVALFLYEEIVNLYNTKNMDCLAFFNTAARKPRGYSYSRQWYKESLEWEFEGSHFFIPKGYHEILYLKYGDYHEFPPVKDRVGNSPAEYIRFSDGLEIKQR